MNIAIDFGTSFTYVGTWVNNMFIPLIHGDTNVEEYGYPTTLQTVPTDGDINNYQCEVVVNGRKVRIECFAGYGMQAIKKYILENFQKDVDFNTEFTRVNQNSYWTANCNGVTPSVKIICEAFFEVLLKLTFQAVQRKIQHKELKDSALNKIRLCFPNLEKSTNYCICLRDAFFAACKKVEWTNSINKDDIIIESENRCVPAIVDDVEPYASKRIMFIDIGGSTCDTCIKSVGATSDVNPSHFVDSVFAGTTELDDAIILKFIDVNHLEFRKYANLLQLTKFKANIEQGRAELLISKPDLTTHRVRINKSSSEDNQPTYDGLNVWDRVFKKAFEQMLHTVQTEQVDYIVLSGGGSKISNIIDRAKQVFSENKVKTIEEIAQEIGETKVTANNAVCYGAAKVIDVQEIADKCPNTPEGMAAGDKAERLGATAGIGTCDGDIRFRYTKGDTGELWYHLFVKSGTYIKNPVYSPLEEYTNIRPEGTVYSHIGQLERFDRRSESDLSQNSVADNEHNTIEFWHSTTQICIPYGTQEHIGVIACQGISSIYFIVATYTDEQITCDDKTYNKGDLINESLFSMNPLPKQVLHAPSTKVAYDYAKENGVHPDFADSEYKKSLKTPDKTPTKTPEAVTKTGITDEDKREAESKLETKYNSCHGQISWIHILRKKKLKNAYSLYESKICRCSKKEELEDLLNEAQEEFDRI